MENFVKLDGIDASLLELMEAAGFLSEETLVGSSAEHIYSELAKANGMLQLVEAVPELEVIGGWLRSLGAVVEPLIFNSEQESSGGNEVDAPKVAAIAQQPRALSLFKAQPLSEEFIETHAIDLAAMPLLEKVDATALDLRERSPGRDIHIVGDLKEKMKESTLVNQSPVQKTRAIDVDRVKTFDDFLANGGHVAPLERAGGTEISKAPRPETNAGVDPKSKRYLRGVLHKEPARTGWSAVMFLVSILCAVLSLLPTVYVLFNTDAYIWAFLTPAMLVVAAIIYLSAGSKATCPVCRQKQFVPKACRKHVKAHTMPMFGHMLPTALHMLLYKWFHCIFCGTSIRIKE